MIPLNWHREPLARHHVNLFDRVIRRADLIECLSNGSPVRTSLDWAIYHGGGECWAVKEGDAATPVGVYGWTHMGAIWSYWADLNPTQGRELMRRTPEMVLEMAEHAEQAGLPHLANYVWEGNREAVAWLRASHCFTFDLDHRYEIGHRRFISFQTKPVKELRTNV